jgi:hypothetical protein
MRIQSEKISMHTQMPKNPRAKKIVGYKDS